MTQPSSGPACPDGRDRTERTTGFLARAWVLGVVLAGLVLALGLFATTAEPLHASHNGNRHDIDGDALPNVLELGYAISPDHYDTDGDGYGDGEEFARGSAPDKAFLVPTEEKVSIGMGAYFKDTELRAVAVAYVPDGNFSNMRLSMGYASGSRPQILPAPSYISDTVIHEQPVGTGAAKLVVFDLPLSLAAVVNAPQGRMSYYTTLSHGNEIVAAATVHLTYTQGAVLQLFDISSTQQGRDQAVIHRLVGGSHIPDGWVTGALCFQQIESVGFVGPLVKHEVVAAGCQDGWDGYCDPAGCDSSVGTTFEVLDPGVLIGG